MSQETEEKFGKIIHNGRIIDLDSLNEEEREALIEEIEKHCDELSIKKIKLRRFLWTTKR